MQQIRVSAAPPDFTRVKCCVVEMKGLNDNSTHKYNSNCGTWIGDWPGDHTPTTPGTPWFEPVPSIIPGYPVIVPTTVPFTQPWKFIPSVPYEPYEPVKPWKKCPKDAAQEKQDIEDFLKNVKLAPVSWRTKQHKDRIELSIDVPGVRADDLDVQLDGTVLRVSGKRFDSGLKVEHTYAVDGSTYDPQTSEAFLDSGVLTVVVKRHVNRTSKTIKVTVK